MKIPIEFEGEYIVRVMDLPDGSNGFVVYDDDDFANVYVNARLNRSGQKKALDHEMTHIINDDIHNDDAIHVAEARASSRLKSIPRLMKARDLIKPEPVKPKPRVRLTNYQLVTLRRCIRVLDDLMEKSPL